ncbi:hypothetical protein [Methylomonas rhizoryzae]|uniref:hypothetical protein n=1 Tax=Methylomonas rhizoryzae TaxID=2608981 RepID=UPI001231CABF|nr:hypothetical protein [Methylomonas rhizoryzae]
MAPEDQPDVQFKITSDEAIVLFEFLQRFSNTEKLGIEDQAEERALWNLYCVFEKYLVMPFDKDYPELLREARERLRDEP